MARCKYKKREHQISYDNGVTWDSIEVIKGDLIEYGSSDCPDSGSEITKWVDLEGDYICEDKNKYKKQILYVSYDGGSTWYVYFPTVYRKGEYIGVDEEYCNNKFEGHYELNYGDPIKIVKCNGNPTLTRDDVKYYYVPDLRVNLLSAAIGNCVTEIGTTFSGRTSLSSVTIGSGVTSIGDYAFSGCSSLASVTIGSGVTSLGRNAFRKCTSLSSVTIPDSVTSIGYYAFHSCSGLTSVTIGSGVTSIGDGAFNSCGLTSVTIPNSVTSIGGNAFYGCGSLTSVTIGDSVTSISVQAFRNCTSLSSVTIGDSVTSIGISAFFDCSGLTSVTIGSGVTSLGSNAFYNCSGLTSVTINAVTPPALGEFVFFNTNNCIIYVPAASVSAYQSASGWSDYASRIQAIP